MNIQEDYVSFETAKLLKEKGFNESLTRAYIDIKNHPVRTLSDFNPINNSDLDITFPSEDVNLYSMPTLQMAMKWLREVHNIFIGITSCTYPTKKKVTWTPEISTFDSVFPDSAIEYGKYEDACEAAIKYCLEKLV